MDKYKHKVSFVLEKRKGKDNCTKKCETTDEAGNGTSKGVIVEDVPILASITFSGDRIYYYTGCRIDAKKWDADKQRVKQNNVDTKRGILASDINSRLNKISVAVDDVFKRFEVNGDAPTKMKVREELKREMGDEVSPRKSFEDCYRFFIERRGDKVEGWSQGTITKHNTILKLVLEFCESKKIKDIKFDDIDIPFLTDFVRFLNEKKQHTNAYVAKNIHDLKWFFNWATKRGFNKNLAYKDFTPPKADTGKKEHLTREEFLTLYNLPISQPYLDRVRNLFCFCCATGLRYSDAIKLQWIDVKDGYIEIDVKKTHSHIPAIPLNEFSQGILDKYAGFKDVEENVFPRISNQKYNDYLKDLGKLAGFNDKVKNTRYYGGKSDDVIKDRWELLTSHTARRTFICLSLSAGIPSEVVRSYTGHKNARAMEPYVNIAASEKFDAMKKFHFAESVDETIFDFQITDEERQILCIPDKDDYIRIAKADSGLVNLHLALLFHLRGDSVKSLEYVAKLPDQMKVQYIQTITTGLKNEQ